MLCVGVGNWKGRAVIKMFVNFKIIHYIGIATCAETSVSFPPLLPMCICLYNTMVKLSLVRSDNDFILSGQWRPHGMLPLICNENPKSEVKKRRRQIEGGRGLS